MLPTTLRFLWPLVPLGRIVFWRPNFLTKLRQQTNMTSCWKYLDQKQNNCKGLIQWAFVPLGLTLSYTTSNMKNLWNCLEANQCFDENRWNHNNWHPCNNLTHTRRRRKSICPVWISPIDNLITHPRTICSINECWSN